MQRVFAGASGLREGCILTPQMDLMKGAEAKAGVGVEWVGREFWHCYLQTITYGNNC